MEIVKVDLEPSVILFRIYCTESLNYFLVLLQVLAVVLPLDEKKDVSTVVKPVEPVTVDLSDDDDDDCVEVSAKSPVKAEPKPSTCSNFLKPASVRQASIPSLSVFLSVLAYMLLIFTILLLKF